MNVRVSVTTPKRLQLEASRSSWLAQDSSESQGILPTGGYELQRLLLGLEERQVSKSIVGVAFPHTDASGRLRKFHDSSTRKAVSSLD